MEGGKVKKMRKNDSAPSDKYSSYEGQIENLGYKFGLSVVLLSDGSAKFPASVPKSFEYPRA